MDKKKVIAICGSTRKESVNLSLIRAIIHLFDQEIDFDIYRELSSLPQFNPDLDDDDTPEEVVLFRKRMRNADGILISTPEYAMGVPGSLKNAIDWTVSSMEFSHKPVALITASSQGQKGHASLLETLKIIESDIPAESQLVIPFAKTRIQGDEIIDPETLKDVRAVIISLLNTIIKSKTVSD